MLCPCLVWQGALLLFQCRKGRAAPAAPVLHEGRRRPWIQWSVQRDPGGGGAGPPPGGKPPPPRRASVCTLLAFGAGPPPGEKRWPPHAPSRRHRRRGPPVLSYSGHGDGVGSQGVGCRAATAERFWAAAIHIFVTAVLARRGWRRHRGHRATFAGALGPRGVGHSGFGVWQLTVAAACSAPDAL